MADNQIQTYASMIDLQVAADTLTGGEGNNYLEGNANNKADNDAAFNWIDREAA